jgi:RNA polymerase sigma-70 factor, ECF subfamily
MIANTLTQYSLESIEESNRLQELEEVRILFRGVARGDREAFAQLHHRFSALVYATVIQVLHNHQDTEDVVQEVFALLWKKADMYSEERGKPTTWLTTLARNRAIDKFRSRDRRSRLNDGFEQESEMEKGWQAPSPSGETEVRELAAQARTAVMQLSPEQRQAIQLAFLDGLTQAEISERTGAPLGTVKARIRRGLGKLRSLLRS